MQPEIYYQNSQSFYPSESYTLDHIPDHIIMRRPVTQYKEDMAPNIIKIDLVTYRVLKGIVA